MKIASTLILVVVAMAGCDGSKVPVPAASPVLQAAQVPPAPPDTAEATLSLVIGRVRVVPDGRPMVDGWLISAAAFEERFGADWLGILRDRRVRVTGREESHPCGPEEECLSDGEVRRLTSVRMIEVCWSPDLSFTMGRKTVPCLPTPAEERACNSACSAESQVCSATSRTETGTVSRRCGCAMVTCEQNCAKSGEVDFRCH